MAQYEDRDSGRDLVVAMEQKMPAILQQLPPMVPSQRFQETVMMALQTNPQLRTCAPASVFNACMKAAMDGLIPDGRLAALVPFKGQAQYMPMVQGIIKKLIDAGQVDSVTARCVYKGDKFEVLHGTTESINHVPLMDTRKNEDIVAAYAVARKGGAIIDSEVMLRNQIDQVRQASRAANSPMWAHWYDQAAIKTVLRRLAKRLATNPELSMLFANDDAATGPDDADYQPVIVPEHEGVIEHVETPVQDDEPLYRLNKEHLPIGEWRRRLLEAIPKWSLDAIDRFASAYGSYMNEIEDEGDVQAMAVLHVRDAIMQRRQELGG